MSGLSDISWLVSCLTKSLKKAGKDHEDTEVTGEEYTSCFGDPAGFCINFSHCFSNFCFCFVYLPFQFNFRVLGPGSANFWCQKQPRCKVLQKAFASEVPWFCKI